MTQKEETPVVISLYRHFTEYWYEEEGKRLGGWGVWVQAFSDPDLQCELIGENEFFSTKKEALAYSKKRFPGVKVLYSTEATRKQRAA